MVFLLRCADNLRVDEIHGSASQLAGICPAEPFAAPQWRVHSRRRRQFRAVRQNRRPARRFPAIAVLEHDELRPGAAALRVAARSDSHILSPPIVKQPTKAAAYQTYSKKKKHIAPANIAGIAG